MLTGYFDPPAGHVVDEGMHYNAYFPGGNISMAKALYEDIIEYEDGTPATTPQLAKDVSTFLRWAAEPELDLRKLYFIKVRRNKKFAYFLLYYCTMVKICFSDTTFFLILGMYMVSNSFWCSMVLQEV